MSKSEQLLKSEISHLKQVIFKMQGDADTEREHRSLKDIEFLEEMKARLDKAIIDPTQMQMVKKMIGDWISQLKTLV